MMRFWVLLFLIAPAVLFVMPPAAQAAYDANGIALGASEKAVTTQFPSAFCKPLQWTSQAADRRCDDSKIVFGGVMSRITFYLKQDRVQAFDLRFESRDTERLVSFLKSRYGSPVTETRDKDTKRGGDLTKLLWENGGERAVLVSQNDKRRASLTVSRGAFEEEIYRVR